MKSRYSIITGIILVCILIAAGCRKKDPHYDFWWSDEPVIGIPVNFYSNANPGDKLLWDFGDGATSTETNPNHTFNDASTYKVSLTVNDYTRFMVQKNVMVGNQYSLNFSGVNVIGDTIRFSTNAAPGTSLLWDFGDGSSSNIANPYHIYGKEGVYIIKLRINGHYDAEGSGTKLTILKDPKYTNLITGIKQWRLTTRKIQSWLNIDTSTFTNDTFSIGYLNKITVSLPDTKTSKAATLGYNPQLSHDNVLVFTDANRILYFDRVMDTLCFQYNYTTQTRGGSGTNTTYYYVFGRTP
ncbi:MAG: PKD domain-containing protein [Bacteroidetes bacterium]|nr:PKD domain-containing protein [Bacteroidota bacterium]